ncbi:MAG: hypothetical protein GW836_06595 [Paraglaciecola sp.]|nr:hypothetical protein [Paraglaciecola sp.]
MIVYCICSVVFSLLYYVQGFKSGLTAKKWAMAGLIFGPMLYPLFRAQKRLYLHRARGLNSVVILA